MPNRIERGAAPADRWLGLATLPITLLVQSAVSAALIAPTAAAPRLLQGLGVGTVFVGVYIAIAYFAAMLSSLWGASLVRRWGPITTSAVALAVSAAGLLLVGQPHPAAALVGAWLIGSGYGPITPASSEMLARTTPATRLALVFSIKQTGVPLGGVLAGLIVPFVLEGADAPRAMLVMAAVDVAAIALALLLRPSLDRHRDPASPFPTLARMRTPLAFVWRHPILRGLALCSFVFSSVQVSFTAYTVSYLHDDLTWSLVAAGAALSVAQTAAVVGRILWGWMADFWAGGPRLTLFWLAAAMALVGIALAFVDRSTAATPIVVLLAIYGATAIGWNGVFLGTVARVVPHDQAAMATAGCLFCTYFGVVVGLPSFGLASSAIGRIGPAFALTALPLAWTLVTLWRAHWPMRASEPAGT